MKMLECNINYIVLFVAFFPLGPDWTALPALISNFSYGSFYQVKDIYETMDYL